MTWPCLAPPATCCYLFPPWLPLNGIIDWLIFIGPRVSYYPDVDCRLAPCPNAPGATFATANLIGCDDVPFICCYADWIAAPAGAHAGLPSAPAPTNADVIKDLSGVLPEVVREILAAAPCRDAARYVLIAWWLLLPSCQIISWRLPLMSVFTFSGVLAPVDSAFAPGLDAATTWRLK